MKTVKSKKKVMKNGKKEKKKSWNKIAREIKKRVEAEIKADEKERGGRDLDCIEHKMKKVKEEKELRYVFKCWNVSNRQDQCDGIAFAQEEYAKVLKKFGVFVYEVPFSSNCIDSMLFANKKLTRKELYKVSKEIWDQLG